MSVSSIHSEHTLAARIRGLRSLKKDDGGDTFFYQHMSMSEDMIEAYETGLLKWTDESTALNMSRKDTEELDYAKNTLSVKLLLGLLCIMGLVAFLIYISSTFEKSTTSSITDVTSEYAVSMGQAQR